MNVNGLVGAGIMSETPHEKCRRIFEHYGFTNQLIKLCEECGELIQAACRVLVDGFVSDNFIEELADVKVMIMQMEYALSGEDTDALNKAVNRKLDRQLKRIEDE